MRHIIREQLLLEKKIADIRANLTITFDLRHDVSGHSEKRKWRHVGQDVGRKIYDYDILKLIEAAKDDIVFNIVNDQITNGVRFIVSQSATPYLNVVIEPKVKNPYHWDLVVITQMDKKDFEVGRDQLQIFVPIN